MWTDEQIRAARDAINVAEGACNGRGIARALVKAMDAWSDAGTDISNRCPPAILMLEQLAFLAGGAGTEITYRRGGEDNPDRYHRARLQCIEIDEMGQVQEARSKYLFQNDEVKAQFERDREYAVAHGMIANFEYCERGLGRQAGPDHRILIQHDNLAHSFGFAIVDDKNERAGLNGGMIFHQDLAESKKPWQIHT